MCAADVIGERMPTQDCAGFVEPTHGDLREAALAKAGIDAFVERTGPRGSGFGLSMVFATQRRPSGRLWSAKTMIGQRPHRTGVVIAKRPKRSEGAASWPLDDDGPMWPPREMCAHATAR